MKKTVPIALIAMLVALQSLSTAKSFPHQSENILSIVKDSGYIIVDGGKLFYEIAVQGENIVLLHDGMVNREIWDEQFPGSGGKNLLNKPESILFDEAHHRYLFSNYETGDIVQIDSTGKQSILVKDKGAIQGLVIVGNAVYVGARNSVRGFDLTTGEMVMNVAVPNVSNLNDVTADDAGNLYASDVFGTRIIKIRISDQSWSVFVDGQGIAWPNGIFFDRPNNRILVCSFRKNSPIQAINVSDSTVSTLAETTISNCDGITVDRYGRCYVTSWPTKSIYRFDKNFSNPPETFRTGTCAAADISYDRVHDALAIPLMLDNNWEIVPIIPPEKQ
ncbi:MAG: SMP-30/gluconolactonase/LRE family protein [Bacteroidia bacterium]|nr:SMP-30/gluconolactonase/LRE family protein [Bacteroidia bacterium]